MNKATFKDQLSQKVNDFSQGSYYTSSAYTESEVRQDFIDPFWRCLGWKIGEQTSVPVALRDVRIETNVKSKHPDYQFQPEGKVRFFCEAKKPTEDHVRNKDHIYQAKRYAFSFSKGSVKAPFVILTDFEEFRFFKAQTAPNFDHPEEGLIKEFDVHYTHYLDEFDRLWEVFSCDSVRDGSLDQFLQKDTRHLKTLDRKFLEDLVSWRESLAHQLIAQNHGLNEWELNEAVQRLLDRLIFIRMMEDREIEGSEILSPVLKNEAIYPELVRLFQRMSTSYNGLLFKPHFSEKFTLDNASVKEIIKNLYPPHAPYRFDVMEVELLGRIYEKFLGSKIRITERSKRCKVEEKPEVRHAGGVYYTPQYIVDYIVKNTVGKVIEGKTPDQIKDIKILDPACGSGSFLLGAFSYLVAYHQTWYTEHLSQVSKPGSKYHHDFYKTVSGEIKVSLSTKKAILKNNLFGVDIDREATEVTILSLYLKLLEDGIASVDQLVLWAKGTLLPEMSGNVQCGNSLIGLDYFDGKLELDSEELRQIKPFDWHQAFPEIMKKGGFDVVIGNPPYGAEFNQIEKYLIKTSYLGNSLDSAAIFFERCLFLSKEYFGFIVPKTIAYYNAWSDIRTILLSNSYLYNLLDVGIAFSEVNLEQLVVLFTKVQKVRSIEIACVNPMKLPYDPKEIIYTGTAPIEYFSLFNIIIYSRITDLDKSIISKILQKSIVLDSIASSIFRGLYIPDKEKETIKQGSYAFINRIPDVQRYYINKIMNIDISYNIKYVDKANKIMVPRLFFKVLRGKRLVVFPDLDGQFLTTEKLVNCVIKDEFKNQYPLLFLTALINSTIPSYFIEKLIFSMTTETSRVMDRIYSGKIPIPNLLHQNEKKSSNQLSTLAQTMLDLNKQKQTEKTDTMKKNLEHQIQYTDIQINRLVYELYGLTEEEIAIVEGGT